MAAGYVSNITGSSSGGTSIASAAYTTSGNDRCTVVLLRYTAWGTPNTGVTKVTSITRDGQSFTQLDDQSGAFPPGESSIYFELWRLNSPNTASAAITFAFDVFVEYVEWIILNFDGVDTTGQTLEMATLNRDAVGDSQTVEATLTLGANDLGVAAGWAREDWAGVMDDPFFTAGTERVSTDVEESAHLRVSTYTGTGDVTATFDMDKAGDGVGIYQGSLKMYFLKLPGIATDPTAILTKTLDAITLSAGGTIGVSGTLSKTIDGMSLLSAGALANSGSLASTLGAVTVSAEGILSFGGELSKTLDSVRVSSTGAVALSGSLAKSLDSMTLQAASFLGDRSAFAFLTLDGIGLAATATKSSSSLDEDYSGGFAVAALMKRGIAQRRQKQKEKQRQEAEEQAQKAVQKAQEAQKVAQVAAAAPVVAEPVDLSNAVFADVLLPQVGEMGLDVVLPPVEIVQTVDETAEVMEIAGVVARILRTMTRTA